MNKNELIPAIIQDAANRTVLMLGYMNDEALAKTKQTGTVWFWSRSRKRLWQKGETSGNMLSVVAIQTDCDNDTLLISVNPAGPTCHTGSISCFTRSTLKVDLEIMTLERLFSVIENRKKILPNNSYTADLLKSGTEKIRGKITEESEELVRASKIEGKQRIIEETADLLYHMLVLLAAEEITLREVNDELTKRSK